MKTAYFDCFSGISGDMFIGSLIDAGLEPLKLKEVLSALPFSGYEIHAEKIEKSGIRATRFWVESSDTKEHRSLAQITEILNLSSLNAGAKERATAIFKNLASAEAKIHGVKIEDICFHEIGAIDSIVDIVGAVAGLDLLGIDAVYASRINVGEGLVHTSHGILPVPAPATVELLAGVPIYSSGIQAELATPTGAAVIAYFAKQFGSLPDMKIYHTGYGAGAKDLPVPNVLRVYIGEMETRAGREKITTLETNIDDLNPEFYQHVAERLFQSGALDVFTTPVIMKKSRPGVQLTVLSEHGREDALLEIIFNETTTAGVRISSQERKTLDRSIQRIQTGYGPVSVKVFTSGGRVVTVAPEYEECRGIALERGLPLKQVYDEVKKEALSLFKKNNNR
ncbi:MAG: TIGR00299 family protein [Spirochaetes bacterium RBG_16_49_21]|nr:MAG: TIGR00299 family protein [Spirochaetes bacterium RBG_16_49_21]